MSLLGLHIKTPRFLWSWLARLSHLRAADKKCTDEELLQELLKKRKAEPDHLTLSTVKTTFHNPPSTLHGEFWHLDIYQ